MIFLFPVKSCRTPNFSGIRIELEKSGRENFGGQGITDVIVAVVVNGRKSRNLLKLFEK